MFNDVTFRNPGPVASSSSTFDGSRFRFTTWKSAKEQRPFLIAAIEQIYPKALRQRCLIQRVRNVLAKIPTGMQAEVSDGYWGHLRHHRPHHRTGTPAGR